jgi:ABC-type branched-subunit amino acid transport system substrate-binding protein
VVLLLAGTITLAACGSSGGSSAASSSGASSGSSATTAAAAPKGTPIKVMTIASVHYNGPSYPNILEAATLYGQWVNAHGGLNGHPLQVQTCDDQSDPNVLANCGRKAVSNGDTAVVGSFTLNGNSVVPLLAASKTAWFGICCAVEADELTNAASFPLGSGIATATGEVVEAWKLGCRKIAGVALQSGFTAFEKTLMTNGLKSVGGTLAKFVTIPLTAQDYSPQVAQATEGTDCIAGAISDTNWLSFLPAFQQSGSKQRLFGAQGNLDDKVAKAFPQATQNSISVGSYPDLVAPPFATMRAAMKQFNAPTNLDYNSLASLGTWAAYTAFANIVKTMTGPINNKTFFAAASKASHVTTAGMAPAVNFTKPWTNGLPGFARLFNRAVTYEIGKSGKFVPFNNNQFVDLTNAILGK